MNLVKVNKSRSNGMTLVVPTSLVRSLGDAPDYMSCEVVDNTIVFRPLVIKEAVKRGKP